MKSLTVFILVMIVLLGSCTKSLFLLHYQLHKSAYAAACENKARPDMKCNGQCHMKKEMNKAEAASNVPANHFKGIKEILLYAQDISSTDFFNKENPVIHSSFLIAMISARQCFSIFHPPGC